MASNDHVPASCLHSAGIPRELSVFINCPFDDGYQPLFHGILLATMSCGFFPRSALETGTTSLPRMERILRSLFSSKYSIHDLSRCHGEGNEDLARFNMPLELGMAMGLRFLEVEAVRQHDWLVMVPEGHGHLKFVSDLAGFDPANHKSTVESVVPTVMSWLATRPEAPITPTPQEVLDGLAEFEARRSKLSADWKQRVPWPRLLRLAKEIAQEVSISSAKAENLVAESVRRSAS